MLKKKEAKRLPGPTDGNELERYIDNPFHSKTAMDDINELTNVFVC